MDLKVKELSQKLACRINAEKEAPNLFVNWQQVQEMANSGMYIGSHTRSHRILSHLSLEEQTREMKLSKEVIENKIGVPVVSIAYPVGNNQSFTNTTCELAKSLGYQCGFSFVSGRNSLKDKADNFHLKRIGIDGNASIDDIKKKVSSYT
tara:strand:- start:149 stop:598 length:450 start_codon:yes stop_codon:yes gene_type:complete